MVVDIGLITVVVALAAILVQTYFSSERINQINDLNRLYNISLSDLAKAEQKKIITEQEHKEAGGKINNYYDEIKPGYNMSLGTIEWAVLFKLFLPMLLTIEILLVTLQEFGWFGCYEKIWSVLNEVYVVFITQL